MKKKLLAVLLAASMIAGLTACGGGKSDSSAGESEPAQEESSEAEAPAEGETEAEAPAETEGGADTASSDDPWADVDTSEHVKIVYMTTGDAPSGDKLPRYEEMMEQLNAILTEKVNAELETYFISWTDYLSNYNLTLARMDGTVDLVGTASSVLLG